MSSLELDERQFQVYSGPRQFDEPGALKYGGYCQGGAALTSVNYRVEGPYSGDAAVEVVVHDDAYPYVLHDLLGYMRAAAGYPTPPTAETSRSNKGPQQGKLENRFDFVDWSESVGAQGRTIVCMWPEKATSFATAWYSEANDKRTTVIIRCNGLSGWPVSVINEYLAKYPSALAADPSLLENWEAADLAKWTEILRTERAREAVLQIAFVHLRAYDQQAFGMHEALRQKNDPALLGPGLNKVINNIQAFVREHPEYQVQDRPGAGEDDH